MREINKHEISEYSSAGLVMNVRSSFFKISISQLHFEARFITVIMDHVRFKGQLAQIYVDICKVLRIFKVRDAFIFLHCLAVLYDIYHISAVTHAIGRNGSFIMTNIHKCYSFY